MRNYYELLALSDAKLAKVDPVEMNLLVAKSVPSLAGLEIAPYQDLVDEWAEEAKKSLPWAEKMFQKNPGYWKNDVNFARLAGVFIQLGRVAGLRYKEEHVGLKAVLYTDPSDCFLNGVMDSRQGTCANMTVLFVAVAWRLGWPVSMACAAAHRLCRYDDGKVTYNVDASRLGSDGLSSPEDASYIKDYKLSPSAIKSGSDLRAVTPREMLGLFIGSRARHMQDSGNLIEAEKDYLLARHLFPTNHQLYFKGTGLTAVTLAAERFEANEEGSPLY